MCVCVCVSVCVYVHSHLYICVCISREEVGVALQENRSWRLGILLKKESCLTRGIGWQQQVLSSHWKEWQEDEFPRGQVHTECGPRLESFNGTFLRE